jgi:hypothetical protein
MKRDQVAITCQEGGTHQLHQALLLLKRGSYLSSSVFFREAIAEKLQRLMGTR